MKLTTFFHSTNLRIQKNLREKRRLIYIGVGVLFGLSIIAGYIFYVLALNQVFVDVDGERYGWKTLSGNVAGALREKRITIHEGDVVKPDLQTAVSENLKIEIIRAFPLTVAISGKTIRLNVIAQTVRDVLDQAKIKYNPEDKILPGLDTVVKPQQRIQIIQVTTKVIVRQETIEPGTEYRKDKSLEQGVQKTLRTGRPGLSESTIKVVYEDGREVRQSKVGLKILKSPVSSIVLIGSKPVVRTLLTSRGSYRYIEMKTMVATAYYPGPESCGKYAAFGETYTGKKAGFGVVAVDPRVIKLGTKLYIEGYGKAEAADIGSAIKGNRIDLCYETFREAAMFGVKKIKVYILTE